MEQTFSHLNASMAGRKNPPSVPHPRQDLSESDDGHHSDSRGVGRPNGRVYSPDYMPPMKYQQQQHEVQGSHYQQPYQQSRSTPHLTENDQHQGQENHLSGHDSSEPPYYVQDLVKPRATSEGKQNPEDYRSMIIGGDAPATYRHPPSAPTLRDNRYRNDYNAEPPGHLALPPTDYRQQYFSQGLSGGTTSSRRFSPLRLPLGGSHWSFCSWRVCALAFLALALCLGATTIYLAATQVTTDWREPSQCGSIPGEIISAPPSQSVSQNPSLRDSGKQRLSSLNIPSSMDPVVNGEPAWLSRSRESHHKYPNIRTQAFFPFLNVAPDQSHQTAAASKLDPSVDSDDVALVISFDALRLRPANLIPSRRIYPRKGISNRFTKRRTNKGPKAHRKRRIRRSVISEATTPSALDTIAPSDDIFDSSATGGETKSFKGSEPRNETTESALGSGAFMKNPVSQPVSSLGSMSKNAGKKLTNATEEKKALPQPQDINLYANDIANSTTERKNTIALFSDATDEIYRIIKQPNTINANMNNNTDKSALFSDFSTSFSPSVPPRRSSNSLQMSEGNRDEEPTTPKSSYTHKPMPLTVETSIFSLNASEWPNFSKGSNQSTKLASHKSRVVIPMAPIVTGDMGESGLTPTDSPKQGVRLTLPPILNSSYDEDQRDQEAGQRPNSEAHKINTGPILNADAHSLSEENNSLDIPGAFSSSAVNTKTSDTSNKKEKIEFREEEKDRVGNLSATEERSEKILSLKFPQRSKTPSAEMEDQKLNQSLSDGLVLGAYEGHRDFFATNLPASQKGEKNSKQTPNSTLEELAEAQGTDAPNEISEAGASASKGASKNPARKEDFEPSKLDVIPKKNLKPKSDSRMSNSEKPLQDSANSKEEILGETANYFLKQEKENEIFGKSLQKQLDEIKKKELASSRDIGNAIILAENGEKSHQSNDSRLLPSAISQKKKQKGDPITIKDYKSTNVSQDGVEKMPEGEDKQEVDEEEKEKENQEAAIRKQSLEPQDQRQLPRGDQYPLKDYLQVGKSTTPKSTMIPEESLKYSEKILDEYSNRVSRIKAKADIETLGFHQDVSPIYLDSTALRNQSSESQNPISHLEEKYQNNSSKKDLLQPRTQPLSHKEKINTETTTDLQTKSPESKHTAFLSQIPRTTIATSGQLSYNPSSTDPSILIKQQVAPIATEAPSLDLIPTLSIARSVAPSSTPNFEEGGEHLEVIDQKKIGLQSHQTVSNINLDWELLPSATNNTSEKPHLNSDLYQEADSGIIKPSHNARLNSKAHQPMENIPYFEDVLSNKVLNNNIALQMDEKEADNVSKKTPTASQEQTELNSASFTHPNSVEREFHPQIEKSVFSAPLTPKPIVEDTTTAIKDLNAFKKGQTESNHNAEGVIPNIKNPFSINKGGNEVLDLSYSVNAGNNKLYDGYKASDNYDLADGSGRVLNNHSFTTSTHYSENRDTLYLNSSQNVGNSYNRQDASRSPPEPNQISFGIDINRALKEKKGTDQTILQRTATTNDSKTSFNNQYANHEESKMQKIDNEESKKEKTQDKGIELSKGDFTRQFNSSSSDQDAASGFEVLSRDYNKERLEVTSPTASQSADSSQPKEDQPKSYASISRPEKPYSGSANIYTGEYQQGSEIESRSNEEIANKLEDGRQENITKSQINVELLLEARVSELNNTAGTAIYTKSAWTNKKANLECNISTSSLLELADNKNEGEIESTMNIEPVRGKDTQQDSTNFFKCDCRCINENLTDVTGKDNVSKEDSISNISVSSYLNFPQNISGESEQQNEDTLSKQTQRMANYLLKSEIKTNGSSNGDKISQKNPRRHRHHHGEPITSQENIHRNDTRIPDRGEGPSSSYSTLINIKKPDDPTTLATTANSASQNASPGQKIDKENATLDLSPNAKGGSTRRRKKEKCTLGKRACYIEKIVSSYLWLFGDHKKSMPQFHIVPILYGEEISASSWYWESFVNKTVDQDLTQENTTQQPEDETTTFAPNAGVSHPRPRQTAPPDGASFYAFTVGETREFTIAPYGYWNLHLTLSDDTGVHLAFQIPRGTNLGLYARKDALPTHTQHDFFKIFTGTRPSDSTHKPGGIVVVNEEELLQAGEWFFSLYNDDGDPHSVKLKATKGAGTGECPQRCNGRGHCFLGRCKCDTGYSGPDCSEVLCPILCNGRGEYLEGQCRCDPGWKGKECQLRDHECEVPDCSGHGLCNGGECQCATGFTGKFCQTIDCPNPNCSDHGWCVAGTCVCARGWKGSDCSQMDKDALQCLPDCNNHGVFDINNHSCICNPPWTGSDCSSEACSLDCGLHGTCENDACHCENGWTGVRCTERLCDSRCTDHGQCKNGTCVCMTGWNGRHCTLAGCPGNCNSHGRCVLDVESQWHHCECDKEWEGVDCSVRLEMNCQDGKDNDDDGLRDCQDPECCSTNICKDSQLCKSLKSPIDILLRMQPPAATASFYEKMQFIIQDKSLQSYHEAFNKSRAAVIRGRVVTWAGRPIVGLRVSTNSREVGFTMTRQNGEFDFMVNGGGVITVLLGKSPFNPKQIQVVVPWNEIVVMDDIIMTVKEKNYEHGPVHGMNYYGLIDPLAVSHSKTPCPEHDYDLLRPVVMSTWQNEFQGECPDVDAILVETQAVQESVQIPGTGLYLVYHSSRARGYKSTLRFQLTPEKIPSSLIRVYLRIVLEGILFKKVFEADPLIKFTYSWDRMNIYKQKVYGTTIARVSVGYEHKGCKDTIIWAHHTTKVAGYDLAISDLGQFNLHVHHAYNFHQGILQKGDGRNIHLAGQRHLVTTLLGTKNQRDINCGALCEGSAHKSPLLAPTCLAAAPDGSLYVGDFNLIRRVTPEGKVFTVASLNETGVSYRYHIAVSPVTGKVYVSDPDAHQVLEIQKTINVVDPAANVIPVAGSGDRCLPGDRNKCGDGGEAIHARLTYPKGLAISPNDDLYIADGTNIRVVSNKFIHTVIGGHDHRSHWAPVPCSGTINRDQLRLRWPTELAISPLDGSLHILDDHLVLRLTPDNRVQVLTGRPLHCPAPSHDRQHMSRAALLLAPQSIAFSLTGDLYVGESDTQRINRVRVITTSGHISTFAGADSKCNCRDPSCFCHTFDNVSAATAVFSSISAIAITPDGILHISDQAGYRVRSVKSLLPEPNSQGHYEIFSPDTHEVYVFDRFGKHKESRNLVTGQIIYKFTYDTNANTGKLNIVTDSASNSFNVIRKKYGDRILIENPQKQRVTIYFTMMNNLEKLEAPDGYNISFIYHEATGLIQSKMEGGGRTYSYEYDDQGRLVRAVLPTGEVIALNFDLSVRGALVTATRDNEKSVTAIIRGNSISHKTDSGQVISEPRGEGKIRLLTSWDHEVSLKRTSYNVLNAISPTAAQMFPILSQQQTHIGGELINRYDWVFSPAESIPHHTGMKAGAVLQVNGADLLSLQYDPTTSSETLFSVSGEVLVNISYDQIGRPTSWRPLDALEPTSVSYDLWGHVTRWRRGQLTEEYTYDNLLRLSSVTYGDNTTVRYEFRDQLTKPENVTYPSGHSYGLVYDEAGALRHVVTPKGSAYSLHLSTSLGFYRLRLALPSDTVVMQMRVDEQGRLVSFTHPGEEEILLYEYDHLGRLKNELYGHGTTEYMYLESGLLKRAVTRHTNHDIRVDYKYRTGLVKEMKLGYGSKANLHNVKFHYNYDGSARLREIQGEINSKPIDKLYLRYDNQTGLLSAISDLRITRNTILKTLIQNQERYFVVVRTLDNYGRLSKVVISFQGRDVCSTHLQYDNRGRISEQMVEISGSISTTLYTYMADGQILEATGTHKRHYTHDHNGNTISYTDEPRAEFLHYDECDRVIKAGDGDVFYDDKGFVIQFDQQIFEYNTKGHLIAGYSKDKSWSFSLGYDHSNRVSIYRDHLGNVIQIIYGRPDEPHLISHLHNPRSNATTTLIYDDRNHLIAVDKPEGRYFVATDHNGGPIAFFDKNGSLIRRQKWTPFGKLTETVGKPLWVGVGPWGGLIEPLTGIVIMEGHPYNPRIQQWMTPRWDRLTRATRQVTDVYVYRFMNNDPINPPEHLDYHFNDVSDWLKLLGIQLNKILGSEYQGHTLDRPKPSIDVSALASSEVVSGLYCQYKASVDHLQDLSFFSRSHIQRHVGEWKGAPISRQSYVFGPGLLVSNVNGRVLVTYVPMVKDVSTVVGDVIRTVLNNSLILDVASTEKGKDTFYFIKEEKRKFQQDKEDLERLSGIFNVTHVNTGDPENWVITPTANIIIFYNRRVDSTRNRIIAQLKMRAEAAAWAREARLVLAGRSGTREWDPHEIEQLATTGKVAGYKARHVHPSSRYPILAADPSNILFKHESSRKRRKSRRKERKKGWRRRKNSIPMTLSVKKR